jgi:hypothetical protein
MLYDVDIVEGVFIAGSTPLSSKVCGSVLAHLAYWVLSQQ